jgi:hypothetical protein
LQEEFSATKVNVMHSDLKKELISDKSSKFPGNRRLVGKPGHVPQLRIRRSYYCMGRKPVL